MEQNHVTFSESSRAMPSNKSAQSVPAFSNNKGPAIGLLAARAAWLLSHLSHPKPIQILLALADGQKTTRQICARLGLSRPELSHHLTLLRFSQVVDTHREGRQTFHELTDRGARFVDSTLGLMVPSKAERKELVKKVGRAVDDPEDWLTRPNPQFEDRRPIDLIGTEDEVRVHIIIEAAVQGCFA